MFKLGDKVIVLGNPISWCSEAKADIGKRGTIVRNGEEVGFIGEWGVHIPKSTWAGATYRDIHYTWWIGEKEMKLAREEQLVFDWFKD